MMRCGAGIVLLTVGQAAVAGGFCDGLAQAMMRQVPSGDQPLHGAIAPAPEFCGTTVSVNGAGAAHCAWGFGYRSTDATAAFDQIGQAVQKCLGDQVQPGRDQPVNHPDFFDLRSFETPQATVSVSIKDKINLQRSYVFLRVEPQ